MNNVFAEFLFKVALMLAGYFFVCSVVSYGIDYYFKVKNNYNDFDQKDVEGGE